MKRMFFIALALALLVLPAIACGDDGPVHPFSSTPSAPIHAPIGELIRPTVDWEVTVNSVNTRKGGKSNELKSGDVYLEISVSLLDVGTMDLTISSAQFWTLQDGTGQRYELTTASGVPSFPDGTIHVGFSPLTGILTYEVPANKKQFTLTFAPDPAGQLTIWDITVK